MFNHFLACEFCANIIILGRKNNVKQMIQEVSAHKINVQWKHGPVRYLVWFGIYGQSIFLHWIAPPIGSSVWWRHNESAVFQKMMQRVWKLWNGHPW